MANFEWEDDANGLFSELDLGPDSRIIVGAAVWQPGTRRNWESSIAVRSEGKSLSLASGKVDAMMALRRDAEAVVNALGGKVKWG